jgi:type IV secretory pathway ATPase VirB11/archaellum biosynthesis ATPase
LSFINTMDVNIMTLEDPVEYSLPIIRQSNVRENSGMDFASGVKSMLRQDPDIIFVGEVRDEAYRNNGRARRHDRSPGLYLAPHERCCGRGLAS